MEEYRAALVAVGLDPDAMLPNGETTLDALSRCVSGFVRNSTRMLRYGDEWYSQLIAREAKSLSQRAKWPGYWESMKDPAAPEWC